MALFFVDSLNNLHITWEDLLQEVNNSSTYNPYCNSSNYFEIFTQIINSLLLGEEIVLLDSDFTSEELFNLTGFSEFSSFIKPVNKKASNIINGKNELISLLRNPNPNWMITLFTSGTTGLPKKVSHKFESITRFVKVSEKTKDNIWGLAYNPTHIAGIQVFFQALLNANSIIRLFGLSKENIYNEINKYMISNISATPTFYRLLLQSANSYPSVYRITSGGEKFDEKTINHLSLIFPNAKIINIYASTEAGTIFASYGNNFIIKAEVESLIKIDENELLIHKSLIGNSDINTEEWYRTGDLVEVISKNPIVFYFISRKNEMINIGGYKVNPNEVEETMRKIPGIKDVRVYAKSNSISGNIICCEIIRSDNQLQEYMIRALLKEKLQEFKIPRMINFVNELASTRTGKIKR